MEVDYHGFAGKFSLSVSKDNLPTDRICKIVDNST
jgi:hypothetical protein